MITDLSLHILEKNEFYEGYSKSKGNAFKRALGLYFICGTKAQRLTFRMVR